MWRGDQVQLTTCGKVANHLGAFWVKLEVVVAERTQGLNHCGKKPGLSPCKSNGVHPVLPNKKQDLSLFLAQTTLRCAQGDSGWWIGLPHEAEGTQKDLKHLKPRISRKKAKKVMAPYHYTRVQGDKGTRVLGV